MVLALCEEERSGLSRWGRGSPAKLRREVRLRSMGDSLAVAGGLNKGLLEIAGGKGTRRWLPRSAGSGRGGRSGSYRADYVAFGGLPAEPGGSGRANGGEGYRADDALQRAVCTKKTWVEGREGSSVISPVRSAKGLEGKLLHTHGRARPPTSLGVHLPHGSGAPRAATHQHQHQHTTHVLLAWPPRRPRRSRCRTTRRSSPAPMHRSRP